MYKNTLRKLTGVVLSLSLIIGLMLTMPLPASAGANWIRVTSGTTNALNSICYGNSKYVAVGDGGVILTSSNLSSWSKPSSGTVSDLLGVSTNGSGLFVAVGTNGKVVYSSNNGVNWAATSVSASNTTGCVSYGGGTFLAFFGADCYISTNGSSWTKKATVSSNINGLTYADGKFWAVSSSVSCSSDSGATWSGCGGGGTLNSVISNNATYLISVGNSGNGYMTFYSGSTFPKPTGYSYNYKGIGYGFIDGAIFFVMVGANGATGAIVTTETTASFEDKTVEYMPAGTPVLNAVCYGTTMFVAVGESGAILVSSGVSSPPVFTSGTTASCSENSAGTVYTATATPSNGTSCTYSLAGGVDDSLFNLVSSTGVLTFKSPPNYESPSDSGGNNVYNVIIRATDSMADADQNVAITVTNVNETPTVTSGTSVSVPENQTAAYTATADDPDGGTTITWSITGGADAALFTINGSTGAVTFKSAPNYESPGDSGGNNIYNITVKATDNGGLWDTGDVAITVTDAVDTPAATTGSASSVGAAGAVLSGTVNDNGGDTNVYFEYGATDSYGTSVSAATPSGGVISAGAGSTSVAVTLTGLSAGTPYHYRVKAVNSAGTTYGLDGTFTTIDIEITDFDAIPDVDAGYVGSATYANAAAVIAALPTTIKANGNTVTVDVDTWVETDIYDPNTAGSYTFTATLGTLPTGILNTGGYTATVEVVVSAKTEITGFDAIPDVDAGYAGSATYANAAAVIAALPTTIKANGNTVTVDVDTWVETDIYDPNTAGSYTFTATLGTLPTGILNTGGYTATVEVVVSAKTEITGFDAIPNVDAGYTGSVAYADAAAVIAALPTTVKANGNTVTVPVTNWVDTDTYNPNVAGSYTFTAILGALPTGYLNTGGYTATVEVVVAVKTEITGFDAIPNVDAGYTGSVAYADAAAVIAALPTTVKANGNTVTVPVTNWVDTDTYNPNVAGSYTFTAILGALPTGYLNTGGYTATVEVVVATKTEITGFDAIPNVDAGYTGSVAYADAAAVIAALPTTVKANGNTVTVDVDTWVETDIYDPNTVGSYTFTATLGALPTGYANAGSYTATVEVVVSAKTVLQSITAPAAITGVANGTAKTTTALGLPTTVILVTDQGNVSASVAWDVNSSTYVVSTTTEQTFTVNGTVTLPVGVVNTGNVSLLTSISVTVTGGGEGTISVTGVGLSKSALTLVVGGSTGTLTETVLPKNAANQNVTWESSNTTVATVSGGIVTPVAVGNATITVTTADGGKTASCTATVTVPVTATSGGTTTVDVTPVTITVPESVSEVKIAVSTTDELPLIEVNSSTSLGTVQMSIPEGTRVTGPAGWDGTIPLPTVVSEPSTAVSGAQTVNAVIEVGLDNETITFSKAVRLLIPGMAGKSAGYVRNGVFYSITQTLSADNQATGDSEIAYGAEAKIDSGADLAVWTKHFTEFVAYTPTASSRTSSSSISAPMVLTDAASSTASLSAVLNGEIRSRGGETITAYGVSYSTDKQTWTPVQAGSDNLLGSFSYTLRGLTANTEYYFKAYATNSEGTSYGDIKSFQVLPEQTASSRTVLRFQIGSKDYYVNDQLKSMDTAPIILEDRTLLPIRYVADALGATVSWDESKQKVTITFNGTTTELWIGKGTATVNGVSVPIDPDNPAVKPIIQSPGRSMLPLRFISQNLGCQVDWNAVSQEVKVTYPKA